MFKGNMGNLMKQARDMQKKMATVQDELKNLIVEESAGNGMVTIKISGDQELKELILDPELLIEDKDLIEDLILTALNKGIAKSKDISSQKMNAVTGGMMSGLNLPTYMGFLTQSAIRLIDELSRLPGIGRKTAQRLAFHLLNTDDESVARLAQSMLNMKLNVHKCSLCGGITESDPCLICLDPKRDNSLLCIVEEAQDIFAFERTNIYRGKYHVLGGVLSPLDGIGPDDLNIESLLSRITPEMEIILAMNPSVEGETTSLYLGKLFNEYNIQVTRLARGLPVGGDLEYIDEATLIRAMEGRTEL